MYCSALKNIETKRSRDSAKPSLTGNEGIVDLFLEESRSHGKYQFNAIMIIV
jgi:hypothetical protein